MGDSQGDGTAEKSASSSTSVSSGRRFARRLCQGGKGIARVVSGVEADGLTIGAGIDIFEEERRLAEATAEELESLLRHRNQSKRPVRFARFCRAIAISWIIRRLVGQSVDESHRPMETGGTLYCVCIAFIRGLTSVPHMVLR